MRRHRRVAAGGLMLVLAVLMLVGCSRSAPSSAVLSGRAFGCSRVFPVTVAVYGSRYPGKYAAALSRVQDLGGSDSGEPLVASRRTASGGTYRFTLAPGRYVVYDSGEGRATLVTIGPGQARQLDFPYSCI